ncbi:MAG: hypothetical protein KBH11_02810 [Bacteroidia bacterium]|nr:hypothetical protein [Bacteroidota bacterium]MBP9081975.1 hypothetical protein [Bacteroidia bacterium]
MSETPKNKLSELLHSLTISEQKSFETYLNSPFFRCDKELLILFNRLLSYPNSSKEAAFAHLFPGFPYNDKQMRYLISDLNRHIENFITIKALDKKILLKKAIAAKSLSDRGCEKAYNHVHLEITTGNHFQNSAFFRLQFEHAEEHLSHVARIESRKNIPDYGSVMNHLDTFYILKKLQLSCEIANMANILNRKIEIPLIDEINKLATSSPYQNTPAISIYFNLLQTLTSNNPEDHFKEAEKLIKFNSGLFDPKELNELYQYIKNYCVRKINQGYTEYLKTLFGIYKDMLGNTKLTQHEYMSQYEFKNIVSISLRLGEKKWCKEFLEKQLSLIPPQERINASAYNTAYYYFMTDEFKKAIRKLQEVELNDVFYQLDARVILLKSYYELDETEAFFYQVSSFRLFLLRNKGISEFQKTIYRNLIKFLAAIMRAGISTTKLKAIRVEIEKERNVADPAYLMRKIAIALGEP